MKTKITPAQNFVIEELVLILKLSDQQFVTTFATAG